MKLGRRFWKDQLSAIIIALGGGVFMWISHGFLKGLGFTAAILIILQPGIWWELLKGK